MPVDRAGPGDLMHLAGGAHRAALQVGAVLVLSGQSTMDRATVSGMFAAGIATTPRLRQRLINAPAGCGRPLWVDDPRFDINNHVDERACPSPGDEDALLDVAADALTHPLPADRPLWRATLVTNLAGGGTALVVVFHHVLADGVSGLALLGRLADPVAAVDEPAAPAPAPIRWVLLADAWRSRLRAMAALPAARRRLQRALAELTPAATPAAPRCSLQQPTGPSRRLAIARADLADLRAAAHAQGGTINDAVLTAVTGALRRLLRHRGETVDQFVVSIAASTRRDAQDAAPGNQVGVIPVALPAGGEPAQRLAAVADRTRTRRTAPPDASVTLLAPVFRGLARLGLLNRYLNRQRRINTFVTNLRGPAHPLHLLGSTVTEMVPMSAITGNVTVGFAALSYAGSLVVTIIADRDACPDLPMLTACLQDELDRLGDRPIPGPVAARGRGGGPA